ncbi:hypothetical protein VF14_31780 [Nostoc linckia z18]|uniref:Uncharacterized protein n=2 Tax=Nostoc linckia TaxID=92942 RepID=A0A9Q5Z5W8_NOSLI|nr:hypothetical protein [Nostoc linckia]PHJ95068.1 hypothetical protein VF08_32655 [Nostoc linckia z8]PHK14517.1 hypothetical protein VF11_30585 [Nostoc linckia z14]PHK29227.1 hypothetical protein VF14_31780 [Nostoc linckia z18]PHK34627.1 hypothetical protein VF12_23640 [Nostoc linckia z15]PHJ55776.1 hypothetical protein VF02_35395 [Nostoc linckia z1]
MSAYTPDEYTPCLHTPHYNQRTFFHNQRSLTNKISKWGDKYTEVGCATWCDMARHFLGVSATYKNQRDRSLTTPLGAGTVRHWSLGIGHWALVIGHGVGCGGLSRVPKL